MGNLDISYCVEKLQQTIHSLIFLPGLEMKDTKSKVTFDVLSPEEDEGDKKPQSSEVKKPDHKVDIMAQQYKYIACLKVSLMYTKKTAWDRNFLLGV